MKCKVCGYVPENKVRFCPDCRSYFVDADDPKADSMWKGVTDAEGNRSETTEAPKKPDLPKTYKPGWATCGLVTSAVCLFFSIIATIFDPDGMLLLVPLWIFSVVAVIKGIHFKRGWIGALMLVFSIILFIMGW